MNKRLDYIDIAKGLCIILVVIGTYTFIMDTDFYSLQNTDTKEVYPCEKEVRIGDKVWIGMRSVILKGSTIPDGSIVAANSLCYRTYMNNIAC